ncbi:hypothetical protein GCM10010207_80340 [Streptomyces atratus]|uniref:peptidase inhibitor family I36 protein n=1 Tax=Streptomyces atratus TaxID=1893 RepID=UPI001670DDD3|nr:hypothetical protein GCM10010207_80340 [Streptomyces atratus]
MKKRFLLGLVTATVAASAMATGAAATANATGPRNSPAPAMTPAGDGACDLGYVCGWQNPFFEGPRNLYTTTPTDCVNTAAVVQSITNATGRPLRVWSDSNCTGASDVVDPNQSVGNFSYTIYSVSNA